MKFAHFFIDRPIFAAVLSIAIVIIGGIAYYTLPVAQFPDVNPPTVVVRATYPGATAQTVADTVATPLEQEINGVEDMLYMSSMSTNDGQIKITVTFKLGTDLDKAQVLVQNRVDIAVPRLPEEVRRLGVTTDKESPDLLMVCYLFSPGGIYDQLYISNYATLQMKDVLARLDGVARINIYGAREYSMRVWLDPERMTSFGLDAGEIVSTLQTQNVQVASGSLSQPPAPQGRAFQTVVNTQGRFVDPDQFANVIVKSSKDGRVVRIRDVGRVELGARDYVTNGFYNGEPAVALLISQRPGSNALATAEALKKTIVDLGSRFPPGLQYNIGYDPTAFIADSIEAVEHTVLEAVLLVILVIIVFLQNWRAALIPLAAIPVSLIGTFGVMAAFGYSLNNLTLFGLVLAIGIVVDDAIVVVENVERWIDRGLAPREATYKSMEEVTVAVIAIAFGLSAVFIPTAFISGISGQFYRQFALAIATATLISAFNSLTLSPALAALLLKGRAGRKDFFDRFWDFTLGWFFRLFNRSFEFTQNAYVSALRRTLRFGSIALLLYVGLLVVTASAFAAVPTGFIPQMDQGYIIVSLQLPDGASLERTDRAIQRASAILREIPGIAWATGLSGFSGATQTNATNAGTLYCVLTDHETRYSAGHSLEWLLAEAERRLSEIKDANIVVLPPPSVRGIGTLGGFTFEVQDRGGIGGAKLQEATDALVAAANQDPHLSSVFTLFRASSPQVYADIDRTKGEMLGVATEDVLRALNVYMGSQYVNDFNLFGRTFRVTAQADSPFRLETKDIAKLRARSRDGAMVPLGSLTTFREVVGPEFVARYNLYPAAEINGNAAPGASTGQAIAAMERLAETTLPRGFGFEWTGLYYQQLLAGSTAFFIFPLCVLFVFLTHSAEYESWSLPLIIILIVPMCLLCGIAGIWVQGMDNNIVTQIGFVVLVGLACKNAVLIVEFAKQQVEQGHDRITAALEASRLRLRPILMTSFAFILGVVPLVTAQGSGFEMREALGTTVLSGMLGVTIFGLFLTPVFFTTVRAIAQRWETATADQPGRPLTSGTANDAPATPVS
ncbi:Efflux pump membrane transporter BepE [Phycisphaerae bacterium RAS2]|nr:Efflux pump membrane transporter BepE [Phycisphaerae bacterium RAS2]